MDSAWLRDHARLVVVATAWVLVVVLTPSGPRSNGASTVVASSPITLPPLGAGGDAVPGGPAATATAGSGSDGALGADSASAGARPSAVAASPGAATTAGVARTGVVCTPGARQLPGSSYAAPCVPAFTGDNGGATFRGVDASTILVVNRNYVDSADQRAVEESANNAGIPSREVRAQVRRVFVDHFNETMELYGRQVVLRDFTSKASSVKETTNEGREQACADAVAIAQEIRAFAVLPQPYLPGFGPFSECGAEQGLVIPIGPYGFPETWYQRYHPYVWGMQMACDRINEQLAEYVIKRIAGERAEHALDPSYVDQPRRIGFIHPNIEVYKSCHDLVSRRLAAAGVEVVSEFSYAVVPATMPQQAAQAAVQFKADGVTTLLTTCDFLMTTNLTLQAKQQDWGPEWIITGAGYTDVDAVARQFDQSRVDGHLFGLTPLGPADVVISQENEAARVYKARTGQPMPTGGLGEYLTLLNFFNLLQAAGPTLTPETMASGAFSLPPASGPEAGTWNYRVAPDGTPDRGDHTASDDMTEIYWVGTAPAPDGGTGRYFPTYPDGRRFANGQWPDERPAVYPDRAAVQR